MKYITKYKSPNYNSRNKSKIQLIIIHYTALNNSKEAISYLCTKEKKVSAHYLISQDGVIYNLVNERFRAWHAGQSYWQGIVDINSSSIGIELDYNPNGKNNKFSSKMISSLKKLILKIKNKYKIKKKNVLAHSDIAPFRKKDPGKYFPWKLLRNKKIILNFQNVTENDKKIIEDWFNKYNISSKKRIIIFALSLIGYDTSQVYKSLKQYNALIAAYKSRYISELTYVNQNTVYTNIIKHLFKNLLTKN
tara:strand:+ start:219 stop:965 length:747 start_codon:yes stop_codon:yes gene_type:complete